MRKCINIKLNFFIVVIFTLLLSNYIFSIESKPVFKGGCAKVNITPPIGGWLGGFSARKLVSDAIADELYSKALVLDDGQNTIAIISTDLVALSPEITTQAKEIVKEKIGIPEKNILICATHTHYGPETRIDIVKERQKDNFERWRESYNQTLTKKIASSVLIAYKNMQEVKVGAVKGEIPEIIYNRRTKRADDSVKVTWSINEPEFVPPKIIEKEIDGSEKMTFVIPSENSKLTFGPVEPEVGILRVEDISGEIIGSIVNFSCHPTSVGTYQDLLYSISADFPAYTAQVIEQIEGGICLYTQGIGGNMAAITRVKKSNSPRQQMGKALGGEALRRLQFVPTTSDVTLKAFNKAVNFPLKPDKIEEDGKDYLTTEIQVVKIGDIYILGLPGEILVEVGMEIKRQADIEKLFIVSLTGESIGYVCHSEAYEEGGYETSGKLAKGAGEIMIKESLTILSQIK